jgi:hypothetical protein
MADLLLRSKARSYWIIHLTQNEALACSQLIEQLAYEVQDSTTVIHEHAVYKMICSMLKFHFPGNKIQFKIVAVDESERSDLFLSGWIS